ncbi:hypothetical protein DIPPA_15173 [Diplonema papillatum]|nr:hypothetical protein DIPPA_15173 [Diplonema papillatum]
MSAISPVKLCDLLRDTGDEAESAVTSPAGFGSPKSPEFRREEGAGACAEGRPPEAIAAGGEGNAAGAKRLPSSPQGRGALGTSESVGTSAKGATREDVAASHPPSPQEGIELEKMDGAGSMSAKGVAPEDVTAVHSSSSQDGNDLKKMEAAGTSAKGVTPDDTAAVDPSSLEDGNELGKMEGVGTSAEGVPPKEINGAIPERHLSSPQDGSGSGRVEVSTPQGGTEALATCSQRRQMEGSARDWPPGDTPAGKAGQGSIGGAGRAGGVGSPTAANPLPVCAEAPIAACSQRRQVEGGVQQDRPPKEVTSDQRFTEADLDTDEGYQAWKTDYGARAVERQLRETREEAAAATVQRAYRAYTLRRCAWQRRRARQTLQWQLRQARYTGDKRGVATLAGALAGLGGEPRDPTPTHAPRDAAAAGVLGDTIEFQGNARCRTFPVSGLADSREPAASRGVGPSANFRKTGGEGGVSALPGSCRPQTAPAGGGLDAEKGKAGKAPARTAATARAGRSRRCGGGADEEEVRAAVAGILRLRDQRRRRERAQACVVQEFARGRLARAVAEAARHRQAAVLVQKTYRGYRVRARVSRPEETPAPSPPHDSFRQYSFRRQLPSVAVVGNT